MAALFEMSTNELVAHVMEGEYGSAEDCEHEWVQVRRGSVVPEFRVAVTFADNQPIFCDADPDGSNVNGCRFVHRVRPVVVCRKCLWPLTDHGSYRPCNTLFVPAEKQTKE